MNAHFKASCIIPARYQLHVKVSVSLCIQCMFSPSSLLTSLPILMGSGLMAPHMSLVYSLVHSNVDIV